MSHGIAIITIGIALALAVAACAGDQAELTRTASPLPTTTHRPAPATLVPTENPISGTNLSSMPTLATLPTLTQIPTKTPTPTTSPNPSLTPIATSRSTPRPIIGPTATPAATPTRLPLPSATPSPTLAATPNRLPLPSATPSPTPAATPTRLPIPSATPSPTPTPDPVSTLEFNGFTYMPVDFHAVLGATSDCTTWPRLSPFFNYLNTNHAEGPKKWYIAACPGDVVKVYLPAKGIVYAPRAGEGVREGHFNGEKVLIDVQLWFDVSPRIKAFYMHLVLQRRLQGGTPGPSQRRAARRFS